jgi:hypothetical protein
MDLKMCNGQTCHNHFQNPFYLMAKLMSTSAESADVMDITPRGEKGSLQPKRSILYELKNRLPSTEGDCFVDSLIVSQISDCYDTLSESL